MIDCAYRSLSQALEHLDADDTTRGTWFPAAVQLKAAGAFCDMAAELATVEADVDDCIDGEDWLPDDVVTITNDEPPFDDLIGEGGAV